MKAKLKGVTVYLSPAEYKQMKAAAKLHGRTLSGFIREHHCGLPRMLRGAPKKSSGDAPRPQSVPKRGGARKPAPLTPAERRGMTLFEMD